MNNVDETLHSRIQPDDVHEGEYSWSEIFHGLFQLAYFNSAGCGVSFRLLI